MRSHQSQKRRLTPRTLLPGTTMGMLLCTACQSQHAAGAPESNEPQATVAPSPPTERATVPQSDSSNADRRGSNFAAAKFAAKQDRKRRAAAGEDGTSRLTNPEERAREWYLDRAGEDGVWTFQEMLDAKQHLDQMPEIEIERQGGIADAGIWNWEWLGPGNIGGPIRAIARL